MRTFASEPARRFFSSLTIRTKTFIAAAVVLICLVAMGVIAVFGSREISRNLDELSNSNLPSRGAAVVVNNSVVAAHMRIFRYVSWASNGVNQKLLQDLRDEIEADFSAVKNSFNELAARQDVSAEVKSELSALDEKLQKYESTARDVLDVGRTDPPMATMMLGQTDDSFTAIEANIRKILNAIIADSYSIVENLSRATRQEMLSLGTGLITCFLVSIAARAFVARSIVKPITSITNAMQRLSTGDTAVRLDYADRADEIGRMIEAIEIFRRNALEIQAMQLARREAEEQRTQKRREEMSALAAEFEGSVKQIAAQLVKAVTAVRNNAESMAKAAEGTLTKSGSTVQAVVNTRENVETVARAASELSRTIDELALRTNDVFKLTNDTAE
jgi:methyl-accepting chemotaxis protein